MAKRIELFAAFAKIGLVTFGGGYAMLPLIEEDCVHRRQWISRDEMLQMTVIAESTPGPIAINCATFVGYRQAGLSGALAATIGVILPSFLVIFIVSLFLEQYVQVTAVAKALKGMRIAVALLIARAAISMFQKAEQTALRAIIMVAACAALLLIRLFSLPISSVLLMLTAAFIGLFHHWLRRRMPNSRERGGRP